MQVGEAMGKVMCWIIVRAECISLSAQEEPDKH